MSKTTTVFKIILPNKREHYLSAGLYVHYLELGLIKPTKKHRGVAFIAKWLRAWPEPDQSLRFEFVEPRGTVVSPSPNELDAVARLWRRLLAMGMYERTVNVHDPLWAAYAAMVPDGSAV